MNWSTETANTCEHNGVR